ncbi:MAG TPA: hydroxymethylglutaryl-CoA synthase family protein [Candidatus Binatia bacterium]|nr:hydroxymethylglutaryl-CoA synthase family protein [Candidatus Binatia bacterium]
MSVGIERLAVYVPQYALRLTDLAAARGVPAEKLTAGLGVHEMAIPAPCDDVVTLAATAGARLLRAADVDPDEIGMLLVATETGVDHSKPVSIFVHDLLGIGSRCRVYELKHACYAGTAALMTAADWVRAGGGRSRRALVVAADIARYEIGSAGEPTQGAGAVAMLVGPEPRALVLAEQSGTHAGNVHDFWRPFDRREAIVDGKYSVECYLDALVSAFGTCRALERPALAPGEAFVDRVARLLYHTPFPKMAMKAHRRLIETDWRAAGRWRDGDPSIEEAAAASYRALAAPGLEAVRRVGNTYTASLYVCLAALLEAEGRGLAGRRLGLFSYGSGCCAEFFTGTVPAQIDVVANAGIAALLAARTFVDVDTYERLVRAGERGGEPPADFTGEFVFSGVRDQRRIYGRPGALAA